MKSFIETFMEENKDTQYCPYCLQTRIADTCCDLTNHWVTFKEFDNNTQLEIMKEELANAYN